MKSCLFVALDILLFATITLLGLFGVLGDWWFSVSIALIMIAFLVAMMWVGKALVDVGFFE